MYAIRSYYVVLEKTEDFAKLPMIAKHIIANGEPGIMNLINVQKYARYGKDVITSYSIHYTKLYENLASKITS